ERAPPLGLRGGHGRLSVSARSTPRRLVRAGADPGATGVRELGPARGRAGGGGDTRVLPPTRRLGRHPARARDGREALPGAAAGALRRRAAAGTATGSRHPPVVVCRRGLGGREPPVRRDGALRVVGVL